MVIDSKTKRVIREYPKQHNLILNNGMDMIGGDSIVNCFSRCCCGTGTTPTVDDSGTSQISQATTTVTITGGSFVFTNTATDAGKMIKWDTGEEARIVTVLTTLTATVANSATVAAGEFKVYRTNQTGLATETKRTSTYVTGASNCASSVASNVQTHKRTYDFTAEVGSVTYNELGFSNTSSVGNNLFSRILLGSGVALVNGQNLRVVYSLIVTWTPSTPTTISVAPITNWASSTGVAQIQMLITNTVNSSGTSTSGVDSLEPGSANISTFMCPFTGSTAHNTFNTAGPSRSFSTNGIAIAITQPAYTALNFYREKQVIASTSQWNGTNIRGFDLGLGTLAGSQQGFVYIMDADQTKDNLHTLTVTFRLTWSRTLA